MAAPALCRQPTRDQGHSAHFAEFNSNDFVDRTKLEKVSGKVKKCVLVLRPLLFVGNVGVLRNMGNKRKRQRKSIPRKPNSKHVKSAILRWKRVRETRQNGTEGQGQASDTFAGTFVCPSLSDTDTASEGSNNNDNIIFFHDAGATGPSPEPDTSAVDVRPESDILGNIIDVGTTCCDSSIVEKVEDLLAKNPNWCTKKYQKRSTSRTNEPGILGSSECERLVSACITIMKKSS